MTRRLAFISHPYQDNPEENIKRNDCLCKKIMRKNPEVLPISPLSLFSFISEEEPEIRNDIMNVCFKLIDTCDEFWSYGKSEGCDMELAYASHRHKKIRKMYDG